MNDLTKNILLWVVILMVMVVVFVEEFETGRPIALSDVEGGRP